MRCAGDDRRLQQLIRGAAGPDRGDVAGIDARPISDVRAVHDAVRARDIGPSTVRTIDDSETPDASTRRLLPRASDA